MSKRPINVEVRPRYKDEHPEKTIRRFSKKVKKERIIEKFLERRRFEKPSVKKKRERLRRKKVLDKLQRERENRFKNY
jgi:ribosomal protein S21